MTEHRNACDTCGSGGGDVGDSRLLGYVTVSFIKIGQIFGDTDNRPYEG